MATKDLLEAAGFRTILEGDGWGGGIYVAIAIHDVELENLNADEVAELVRKKLRATQDRINNGIHKRIANLTAALIHEKSI